MKLHSILFALSMAIFMTFQAATAEDNFAAFSIDHKTYDKMSADQKAGLMVKIQELNDFIEEKVRPQIPKHLLEKTKNLKIKILLTDKPGRDGLFVPQETGRHTISVQLIQIYTNGIKALIAHEIFHAIHYVINPNEAIWVREGMAQLFEYITTKELNGMNLAASIQDPMTPLLGLYSIDDNQPAQYGHNQMYFYYLYTHCGKDNFFWKMVEGKNQDSTRGSFLIDAVLAEMGLAPSECRDFSESAIAFEVAKANNQFQFSSPDDMNKYFLYPSDVVANFELSTSEETLKRIITTMPVLSSFRMPLKNYIEQKGECLNCAVYFVENDFPYTVSENRPVITTSIDVILVKLRKN